MVSTLEWHGIKVRGTPLARKEAELFKMLRELGYDVSKPTAKEKRGADR